MHGDLAGWDGRDRRQRGAFGALRHCLCCASTVFLSKAVPFLAVRLSQVHASNNGNFLVLSGDDGLVRLFNYPVVSRKALSFCCASTAFLSKAVPFHAVPLDQVIEEAPHRAFRGHSSFVDNIRFLADDERVISAGGRDRSMMQWRTHGITAPSSHFKKSKTAERRAVPPPAFVAGGGRDAALPAGAPAAGGGARGGGRGGGSPDEGSGGGGVPLDL
eukprot:SAG22_NODE_1978_length_3212_cov_3.220045_8_plen_217_part_00